METTNKSQKRKKSGAENRKASKARRKENERLRSFMKSYITTSSKSSYEDDASSGNQEPLNAAGGKEVEGKDVKVGIENASPGKPCNVEDENEVEDEVQVVQDPEGLPAFDSGRKGSEGKVKDNEMEVQESAVQCIATASEFDSDSSVDGGVIKEFNDSRFRDSFNDFETGHQVPNEALSTSVLSRVEEGTLIIEQRMLSKNPALVNDGGNETIDPALLVGMKFTKEDKKKLCKKKPCQPSESILSERKRKLENVTGTARRRYSFTMIKLGANGFHTR